MNLQDCIQIATDHPICFLATTDGHQPRVRALAFWFADERGFYFSILSPKQLSRQLKANPKVEVCFYNNPSDPMDAKQMRVTGQVEFVNGNDLQERSAKEGEFLEQLTGKQLGHLWEVFRICSGQARFWTLANTLREEGLERISF